MAPRRPQLAATLHDPDLVEVAGLVAEPKLDGHRVLAGRDEIRSRSGRAVDLPHLRRAVPEGAVLDGELVPAEGPEGSHHVTRLRARNSEALVLVAFDVLEADGDDVTARPWTERRALLEEVAARAGDAVRLTTVEQLGGRADLDAALDRVLADGHEGLVLKDPDAPYVEGGRGTWLKHKPVHDIDVVITGCDARPTPGSAQDRAGYTGLTYGFYDAVGELREVGSLGVTGPRSELVDYVGRVARVEHRGQYRSGALRHPHLTEIRSDDDKAPSECVFGFEEGPDGPAATETDSAEAPAETGAVGVVSAGAFLVVRHEGPPPIAQLEVALLSRLFRRALGSSRRRIVGGRIGVGRCAVGHQQNEDEPERTEQRSEQDSRSGSIAHAAKPVADCGAHRREDDHSSPHSHTSSKQLSACRSDGASIKRLMEECHATASRPAAGVPEPNPASFGPAFAIRAAASAGTLRPRRTAGARRRGLRAPWQGAGQGPRARRDPARPLPPMRPDLEGGPVSSRWSREEIDAAAAQCRAERDEATAQATRLRASGQVRAARGPERAARRWDDLAEEIESCADHPPDPGDALDLSIRLAVHARRATARYELDRGADRG